MRFSTKTVFKLSLIGDGADDCVTLTSYTRNEKSAPFHCKPPAKLSITDVDAA